MTKNMRDWLIVIGSSLLILIVLGIAIGGAVGILGVFFYLILSGTAGVYYGFSPNASSGYDFTNSMPFLFIILLALFFLGTGIYQRKQLWGKIFVVSSIYIWCYAGFINMLGNY